MQKFKEKMVKFFLRTLLSRDTFNTTEEALSSIHWVTSGNREEKRKFQETDDTNLYLAHDWKLIYAQKSRRPWKITIMEVNTKTKIQTFINYRTTGTFLEVQWLRLCVSTAGGLGSIPGRGTKTPHAAWCGQKKKKIFFSALWPPLFPLLCIVYLHYASTKPPHQQKYLFNHIEHFINKNVWKFVFCLII